MGTDDGTGTRGFGDEPGMTVDGRGRYALLVLALFVVLMGAAGLGTSTALATRGHVFGFYFGDHVNKTAEEEGRTSEENVCPAPRHGGDKCQSGTSGSGPGQFEFSSEPQSLPAAVAINEAAGYVYVADPGNKRVQRFSSSGAIEPASELNGSGANAWEGKAAPAGTFGKTLYVAVDNSCAEHEPRLTASTCEEFDPSYGDVYVADRAKGVIDKYSASGKYLYQITEAPAGAAFSDWPSPPMIEAIAVDQSGGLLVYIEHGLGKAADARFGDQIENKLATYGELDAGGFARAGLGVDATGNLFAMGDFSRSSKFYEEVEEFNTSGALVREGVGGVAAKIYPPPTEGETPTAVAVESATGDAYVATPETVVHVTSGDQQVERLGEGRLTLAGGLAADSATHAVYVADAGTSRVAVFTPEPPAPPIVEEAAAHSVGASEAAIEAEVNPRSEAGDNLTSYTFEYGPCANVAACPSSTYAAGPGGTLPADFDLHTVTAGLEGLKPDTVYHFRLVATNAQGSYTGGELTFTTQHSGLEFGLPDGRAWELVTPPNKHGAGVSGIGGGLAEAAADGGAITWLATGPIEEEPEGNRLLTAQTVSRRLAGGWSSEEIVAPNSEPTGATAGAGEYEYELFSSDLSRGLLAPSTNASTLTGEASGWTPYLRNDFTSSTKTCPVEPSACWTPLVSSRDPYADVEGEFAAPKLEGATPDLGHVVLGIQGKLQVWSAAEPWEKRLQVVGVLPQAEGGTTSMCAVLANPADFGMGNAVSRDGSRVFLERSCSLEAHEGLYLRDTEAGGAGESLRIGEGDAVFQDASADGSRVLFTDPEPLTTGSGAGDLYSCEITDSSSTGKLECALSDLTPMGLGQSLELQGQLLGAGEEAGYAYFVARAAVPGSGENARKEKPVAGSPNLYMVRGATVGFIATLSGNDSADWSTGRVKISRVSPDGRWLAFMSEQPLTGYDNRDVASGQHDEEVYLYNGDTRKLVCASCDPTGARPEGEELEPGVGGEKLHQIVDDEAYGPWEHRWVAATVPALTRITLIAAPYQSRYLSNGGRLFFDGRDPLGQFATSRTWNVYEYEPAKSSETAATDTCTTGASSYSERAGGCVSLISAGSDGHESAFLDASETGNEVFFLTAAKLVSKDYDAAYDIYDAHACTAETPCLSEVVESQPCADTESCREAPQSQPLIFGLPSTVTFSASGDLTQSKAAPKPGRPSRAEELKRALGRCDAKDRHNKHKRTRCERQARRGFGAHRSGTRVRRGKRQARRAHDSLPPPATHLRSRRRGV